jgi:dTDP-4-dehydrorhamnose reductase
MHAVRERNQHARRVNAITVGYRCRLPTALANPLQRWHSRAVVFLFGANSMLGWSILQARGTHPVVAFCNDNTRHVPEGIETSIHLDDEPSVVRLFAREHPALIIHCAGVCDVETCETSPEFAHRVNVEGTRFLLEHAPSDARIVYCSSDHVFGGDRGPYFEDSATTPISMYGRTRVAAEQLVLARPNTLVIRGGLWIGPSSTGRIGHLDWLRDRHRRNLRMTVVSDEIRSAVWAEDAARRAWDLALSDVTGIRHITATRAVARPELAAYLNERFAIGASFDVEPRRARRMPHLGNVELATRHAGALAQPLPSVVA